MKQNEATKGRPWDTVEKHTQGPLKIVQGRFANQGHIFLDGDEPGNHLKQGVARMGYAYSKDGQDCRQGNARRLCAAWNALIGLSTEQIEALSQTHTPTSDLIQALKDSADAIDAVLVHVRGGAAYALRDINERNRAVIQKCEAKP